MSNRIKHHQQQDESEETGMKIWIKIVFIIIGMVFILGMIVPFALLK